LKRLTVTVLAAVGVLALVGLMPRARDLARVAIKVAEGNSPHCPLANALDAPSHAARLTRTKDRMLAGFKLERRDPAGLELWSTPRGKFWIPADNEFTLAFNLAEQEVGIYRAGEVGVRAGDVVIDCGANVGVFTRTALAAGAGLVVAVEPLPANLECLRRNFRDEIAAGSVILYPEGVWDREARLTLRVDPHNTAAASFVMGKQDWQPVVEVPLDTIDTLVRELKLPRVDFIKMDIEGAEPKAIAGARETLARFQPRLAISAYHEPDHPVAIPAAVRAAAPGYHMRCGPCAEAGGIIRPDVLLFW